MNARRIASFLLALLASLALAQEPTAPAEIFRQIAEHNRQQAEFDARWHATTDEARFCFHQARKRASVPHTNPDGGRLKALELELRAAGTSVARTEADLVAAKVKSPEVRAAKLQEAEAQIAAGEEGRRLANAPFEAEKAKLAREGEPLNKALTELLAGVGRKPDGLGISQLEIRPRARNGRVHVVWLDPEDEEVAVLRLILDAQTMRPQTREWTDLSGDYCVGHHGDVLVQFWVGDVLAYLNLYRPDWRGEEKCLAVARRLAALDVLAACQRVEDGVPWRELMRQLTEHKGKWKDLNTASWEACREHDSRIHKAKRTQRAFGQPYDPRRMAALGSMLARRERSVKTARDVFSLATAEDSEERRAKRAEADEEHRKSQRALAEAEAPLLAEKRELEEELGKQPRRALNKLIEGVVRKPNGYANAEAHVETDRDGHALVYWRADGWPVARGTLLLGTPPAIPNDAEKLAGKYPILAWSDEEIVLQVGGLGVRLTPWKVRWKDKEKLAGLVSQLLDLDTVASWPVAKGLGSRDIRGFRVFVAY